mmetsp:Transcript_36176/g.58068  ORF Transcript_36176/g.58068 Transcript_36176/m.58068 type:complete len:86 (-) Transcript_36176:24-281(-)
MLSVLPNQRKNAWRKKFIRSLTVKVLERALLGYQLQQDSLVVQVANNSFPFLDSVVTQEDLGRSVIALMNEREPRLHHQTISSLS